MPQLIELRVDSFSRKLSCGGYEQNKKFEIFIPYWNDEYERFIRPKSKRKSFVKKFFHRIRKLFSKANCVESIRQHKIANEIKCGHLCVYAFAIEHISNEMQRLYRIQVV